MSTKSAKPFDVFLSFDPADEGVAGAVRREFEAAGLAVFSRADGPSATRKAIRETVAFVGLVTRSSLRSQELLLELGAAWVWATPTFLLLRDVSRDELPPHMGHYAAYPLRGGVELVADSIRDLAAPLPNDDRKTLAEIYQEIGVPVDQLITDPTAADEFVSRFASRSSRRMTRGRLVWELIRMRKRGKLPRLTHKATG